MAKKRRIWIENRWQKLCAFIACKLCEIFKLSWFSTIHKVHFMRFFCCWNRVFLNPWWVENGKKVFEEYFLSLYTDLLFNYELTNLISIWIWQIEISISCWQKHASWTFDSLFQWKHDDLFSNCKKTKDRSERDDGTFLSLQCASTFLFIYLECRNIQIEIKFEQLSCEKTITSTTFLKLRCRLKVRLTKSVKKMLLHIDFCI